MTTTICDICGNTLDPKADNSGKLPVIRFNLATTEPERWCHTAKLEIRAAGSDWVQCGPLYINEFDATNFHVCDECVFNAFYRGVQDEFIKRQSAKLKDKPNAGLEQAFDQVFAHAPGKVPS